MNSLSLNPINPTVYFEERLLEESKSLEEILSQDVLISIDTQTPHPFGDFLSPNEFWVHEIQPHLQLMEKGLIVSTGTERSFFDLLLSSEEKCTGLVIRDINPKVKAYADFLILCFRVCSHQEFQKIARSKRFDIEKLRSAVLNSNMSIEMKNYYLKNLDEFSNIWKNQYVNLFHIFLVTQDAVNYYDDANLFNKLKKYAQEGKIVATVGEIGDLDFLKNDIAAVDVSNIHQYSILDFKIPGKIKPRIIYTIQTQEMFRWEYLSYSYESSLNSAQKKKFDILISSISKQEEFKAQSLAVLYEEDVTARKAAEIFSPTDMPLYTDYSEFALNRLQQKKDQSIGCTIL